MERRPQSVLAALVRLVSVALRSPVIVQGSILVRLGLAKRSFEKGPVLVCTASLGERTRLETYVSGLFWEKHLRRFFNFALAAVLATAVFYVDAAFAQQEGALTSDLDLGEQDIYQASLRALTVLMVVAILIENALALIFNWKVFRAYFSERGLKTIIGFAVSFVVVSNFQVDIVASLLDAYSTSEKRVPSNLATQILTAMIVAGGSAGVHNVMRALGYRSEVDTKEFEPPKDKAWIAVRVNRKSGKGSMQVAVTEDKSAPASLPAMAGTVMASRPSIMSLLVRNTNRFPQNGGYSVVPGKAYQISLLGLDENGDKIAIPIGGGPVKLAPGAIVDFDVKL